MLARMIAVGDGLVGVDFGWRMRPTPSLLAEPSRPRAIIVASRVRSLVEKRFEETNPGRKRLSQAVV